MIEETLLAVMEDAGTESWLDQALKDVERLEKVSRSDLGRVLRLLEATGASIALVEVSEHDMSQAMAVITALSNARPWVTVVAVCRLADQETLLQCMRAGARDCVVVGGDPAELRDRLRRHQLVRPSFAGDELQSRSRNLVMIAGVHPRVDTGFLAQNLAVAMAAADKDRRVLAIDVDASDEGVFHLDSRNNFDLSQLLSSPDTLDQTLIETALEEFRPGLRLLSGGNSGDFLGDRGADLFIALTRLMGMFDRIILNVGSSGQSAWVRAIGVHVGELLVVAGQEVPQLRAIKEEISSWRPHLPSSTNLRLVLDGYEPSLPPALEEVGDSTGVPVAAALPMDWRHRLEAINLGLPMQESAPKSLYNKKLKALVAQLDSVDIEAPSRWSFFKRA
ncbi:hypothetical protein A11A3_09120 [Alcanivorax hongdengensis A-11-3]|uniref:Pilus assembly protein TadZ N-terminal domain-containing protein n=1 Tax=Alcanivorax hongdengensis A-11-3 TaxID=1177179 RepID=L0WBH2_9GAMM|nr:hypothetical protein [Alcanivorax hongdengensis]EKF74349.1 hypothetical protein A11A3_09120 [Alcanivorax hongdengensis A-11-3]